MKIRPCGDRALLLDCDSLDEAQQWFVSLNGEVDAVLGARTVLLQGDLPSLREVLALARTSAAPRHEPAQIEIPVVYDGADIDAVSGFTGLTADEIAAAHTGTPWTVAFGGFAPGFSYLVGGDPRLVVPRLDSPRTRVPAGSVGLASEFSGIYPRESPGGWQLIGRTDAVLWDSIRVEPALLAPGMTVRFTVAA